VADVAVLHANGAARERLQRAIFMDGAAGARHRLEYCRDWGSLRSVLDSWGCAQSTVAIVDAYHNGAFAIEEIQSTHRLCPNTSLIGYADFAGKPAQHVIMLVRAGVSTTITLGIDDEPWRIRDALATSYAAEGDSIAQAVGRFLEPPAVQLVIELYNAIGATMEASVIENGIAEIRRLGRGLLAARFGVEAKNARSLERRMASLGLPAPARFVQLIRLLHVGRLLDDPDRTIANVAAAAVFSGDTALHDVIRKNLQRTPETLRKQGALNSMLDLLEASVASTRSLRNVSASSLGA
jgi:AraC-like DNA-binding protein